MSQLAALGAATTYRKCIHNTDVSLSPAAKFRVFGFFSLFRRFDFAEKSSQNAVSHFQSNIYCEFFSWLREYNFGVARQPNQTKNQSIFRFSFSFAVAFCLFCATLVAFVCVLNVFLHFAPNEEEENGKKYGQKTLKRARARAQYYFHRGIHQTHTQHIS